MRKDAKQVRTAELARVQGYHAGGSGWGSENYAYAGFKSNKYFTSDRYIPLNESFVRPDGKPLKGYGLEIETECRGIHNQGVYAEVLSSIIFAQFPADLFKMQNDGSLSGDTSAECITQVMTKEFIRNNYSAFKLMYDTYFPAFNITCGTNCGMHANISRACFGRSEAAQTLAVKKLYYIINKHFDLCCVLLNRDRHNTHYCSRMSYDVEYVKNLDLSRQSSSHGVSFNLGHWNAGRIEIRLVGGQKNYPCFRNTMECIFWLVDAVKRISWSDCDDISKIFAGCNQYVFDRLTKCRTEGVLSNGIVEAVRPTVIREELI